MRIKEKLGFCNKKACFNKSTVIAQADFTLKNDKHIIKESHLCTKHARELAVNAKGIKFH